MDEKTIILIITIPLISALIGWLTNYIAIKSLFRPVNKINILGMNFQGLIPKRKKFIINNIAEVFEEYLFSHKDILLELKKPKNMEKITRKLIPVLEEKIVGKIPEMFRSMASPIISRILEAETENILRKIIDEFGESLIDAISIKDIIIEKLNSYEISNIEKIINKIAKKELKHIELLGGVIGLLVGLFQVGIMIILI